MAEVQNRNNEKAEEYFSQAVRLADALEERQDFERSYTLEADARAQIMRLKGVAYIIRNQGKVRNLAEKALEINPENPAARLLLAQGAINAPRIFGGAPERAVEVLSAALFHTAMSPRERFWSLLTLGSAYVKLKDNTRAEEIYRRFRT